MLCERVCVQQPTVRAFPCEIPCRKNGFVIVSGGGVIVHMIVDVSILIEDEVARIATLCLPFETNLDED